MNQVLDQKTVLTALGTGADSDRFLGNAVEIAIVTRNHRRAIEGLARLGIGPWRIYTLGPQTTTNQTYRGKPTPFAMKACFAQSGNMIWEIIESVSGPTIFAEFLERHDEGIHHVAYDCNNIPFEARIAGFAQRGFEVAQSGSWLGKCHFAFFESEAATTTCLETYAFDADWEYPEPDAWYP